MSVDTRSRTKGAHWGAPPLGYERGRTTNNRGQAIPGALIVDEQWAHLVQAVFSRRAARESDGTWAKLAQYLTAKGAPNHVARAQAEKEGRPVAGTRWYAAGVKSIVANQAYLGEARSGSLVKPGAHPELVDERTWLAANRKGPTYGTLADRKDGPLLGSGLLRCGTCGGGLVRSSGRSRRGRRYEFYGGRSRSTVGCASLGRWSRWSRWRSLGASRRREGGLPLLGSSPSGGRPRP